MAFVNFFKYFFLRPGDPQFVQHRNLTTITRFSTTYFIAMAVITLLIVGALILTVKKKFNVEKQIKVASIVFVVLEGIKMYYFGTTPNYGLNSVIPLFYCSLFMFALLLAGWGKKGSFIKSMGMSFLMGGIVAGYSGLLFSEAFGTHPFGYYMIQTLFYHAAFVYFGYAVLFARLVKVNLKSFIGHVSFVSFFIVLAFILNAILGTNLMLLKFDGTVYPVLREITTVFGEVGHTVMIILIYTVIAYAIAATPPLIIRGIKKLKSRKKKTA